MRSWPRVLAMIGLPRRRPYVLAMIGRPRRRDRILVVFRLPRMGLLVLFIVGLPRTRFWPLTVVRILRTCISKGVIIWTTMRAFASLLLHGQHVCLESCTDGIIEAVTS